MKIVIDGNIGCGKTTMIKRLNDDMRIPIFLEPLHKWNDLLSLFYEDPQKWAFSFNLEVLLTFNEWKENNFPAIYERNPQSCRYVFTENNFESGHLHPLQMEVFKKIYERLAWVPDILIYIRTDPQICYKRMQERGRNCESSVSLDYLQKIHDKYEKLMMDSHVHIIDGNRDKDEVYVEVLKIVQSYVP